MSKRNAWTKPKTKKAAVPPTKLLGALLARYERLVAPKVPSRCFNLMGGMETIEPMVDWLYEGDFHDAISDVLQNNPDICELLVASTSNTVRYNGEHWEQHHARKELRLGQLAGQLIRCQNLHNVPPFTILLACEFYRASMPQSCYDLLCMLRIVVSRDWMRKVLLPVSRIRWPGPPYELLDWVTAAAYDNFTIQVNYNAMQTEGDDGFRMDMTNWMTIYLPKYQNPKLNLQNFILGDNGIFKIGFDKYSIIPSFDPESEEILGNRRARFLNSMRAVANGTFFARPRGENGYQPRHKTHRKYQKPVFGRLQSKNEDVEEEIKVIRMHPEHKHSLILFIGHDGLGDMRVMHLLRNKYMVYLWTAPAVIPILGELPHGLFHLMHMGIRNFKQLIQLFLVSTKHTACLMQTGEMKEPTVKDFRQWEHAILIHVRACAEWLNECSEGGTDMEFHAMYHRQISANFDSNLIFEFLCGFGFLHMQFKNAIRCNRVPMLKLLWRESLPYMRTSEANKTQYAPMAIENTYWDEALVGDLAQIKDANRTLSLNGNESCNVGWDMLPEDMNHLMRLGTHPPVGFQQVGEFAQDLNFLGPVHHGPHGLVKGHCKQRGNGWGEQGGKC